MQLHNPKVQDNFLKNLILKILKILNNLFKFSECF